MILSDRAIARRLIDGDLSIEGIDTDLSPEELVITEERIQPSSVDLRLGDSFVTFGTSPRHAVVDPAEENDFYGDGPKQRDEYIVSPGEFVLGVTEEKISLPRDLRGKVHGRSSWGRLAVTPHIEAGYIDSNYEGRITLEIANLGPMPVKLRSGRRFCQIEFARIGGDLIQSYDGKYQGDSDVRRSQSHEDVV